MSLSIRASTSSASDATQIPRLIDGSIAWLVSTGSTQWGTSYSPSAAFFATTSSPDDPAERVVGAMVLGEEPYAYSAPTPAERLGKEVTLKLLTTDRALKGANVGGELLEFAKRECRRRGVEWIRGDCYRATGVQKDRLIEWYEKQGFRRVGTFEVPDKWEKGLLFTVRPTKYEYYPLLRCIVCFHALDLEIFYCNVACQKEAWAEHEEFCGAPAPPPSFTSPTLFESPSPKLFEQLSLLAKHGSEYDYFLIRAGKPPQGVLITDPVHARAFRVALLNMLTGTDHGQPNDLHKHESEHVASIMLYQLRHNSALMMTLYLAAAGATTPDGRLVGIDAWREQVNAEYQDIVAQLKVTDAGPLENYLPVENYVQLNSCFVLPAAEALGTNARLPCQSADVTTLVAEG